MAIVVFFSFFGSDCLCLISLSVRVELDGGKTSNAKDPLLND